MKMCPVLVLRYIVHLLTPFLSLSRFALIVLGPGKTSSLASAASDVITKVGHFSFHQFLPAIIFSFVYLSILSISLFGVPVRSHTTVSCRVARVHTQVYDTTLEAAARGSPKGGATFNFGY